MSVSGKHQLLTAIALIWLVAASCLLESVDAKGSRNGSKRYSKRSESVNIEIYRPKGVMIWTRYRAGMELFGIQMFINNKPQDVSSEKWSTTTTCDVCLNTTEVSYGKFILRSENAVIRNQDHVFYRAIKKKSNEAPQISQMYDFYVSESRILLGDITGNASPCGRETVEEDLSDADKQQVAEIKLLEDILRELDDQCNAGSENRTKQLLLSSETPTRYDAKQLYQHVARELEGMMPLINWNRTLVEAFYANNGIGFEVASMIDKLKVLNLAKQLPSHVVTDLDSFQTEDMTNDIELWL